MSKLATIHIVFKRGSSNNKKYIMVRTKHTITQYKSNGGVMKFIPTTIIKQQRSNLYKGINAIQERNQNETTLDFNFC